MLLKLGYTTATLQVFESVFKKWYSNDFFDLEFEIVQNTERIRNIQ